MTHLGHFCCVIRYAPSRNLATTINPSRDLKMTVQEEHLNPSWDQTVSSCLSWAKALDWWCRKARTSGWTRWDMTTVHHCQPPMKTRYALLLLDLLNINSKNNHYCITIGYYYTQYILWMIDQGKVVTTTLPRIEKSVWEFIWFMVPTRLLLGLSCSIALLMRPWSTK